MTDFQEWLREETDRLESLRRKKYLQYRLYVIGVWLPQRIIPVILVIIFLPALIIAPLFALCWILMLTLFGLQFVRNPLKQFEKHIREEFVPKVFEKGFPHLKYEPEKSDYFAVEKSGIFKGGDFGKTSKFKGEDKVEGEIHGIRVLFQEVLFYQNKFVLWKTIRRILFVPIAIPLIILAFFQGEFINPLGLLDVLYFEHRTFFRGLFLRASFNKSFRGNVIIYPKEMKRWNDRFYEIAEDFKSNPIRLEGAELDDAYEVYATNYEKAYYVLSPKLLNFIAEIKRTHNALPIVIIRSKTLYMTIPWDKDYFSVELDKPIRKDGTLNKYFQEISSFSQIIEQLNLDSRIWTKE